MKKILQTCFLALLCLVGRYLAASSKVADSPMEARNHRSALQPVSPHSGDTHRGGAILPDTFTGIDFGLVDQHLDPGAGEGASSFHLAQVTVFTSSNQNDQQTDRIPLDAETHRSPVIGHPTPLPIPQLSLELSGEDTSEIPNPKSEIDLPSPGSGLLSPNDKTASSLSGAPRSDVSNLPSPIDQTASFRTSTRSDVINLPSPVSRLPSHREFSLVDDSTSQGQEEGNTPAQVGGVADAGASVFVYGEIRAAALPDSITVTFWEKYLGRFVSYVGMESKYVGLSSGSILQGASGKKVLQYESEPISEMGYISIASVSGDQYLDRFLVAPGDSLIFGLDLRLGQMVFTGPDALKFELQHRLALVEAGVSFMEIPSFHLQKGQDPIAQRESFVSSSPIVSGYAPREMDFIYFGQERRDWLAAKLEKLPQSDSRLLILEEYRGRLSDDFIEILRADVLGENAARAVSMIKNLPLESRTDSRKLLEDYLERIGDLEVTEDAVLWSAFYQEYLLERESLFAVYAGEGLFTRLEAQFSGPLYDRLVGRFLFENYYRLPDFGKSVDRVAEKVSDPIILSGLQSLAVAHKVGSPVKNLPLMNLEAQRTELDAYRGKTVLLAFWFPGCLPSKLMHERQLSKVQEEFANREDFVLLSINTDPDPVLWKTYLNENPSYSFGNEHLFLGGRDVHPFLQYYDIQAYPSLMLVDKDGRLIRSLQMPSLATDLIELISKYLLPIQNTNPKSKNP
jgi:thiol-disulfide isomerase/thioredoxin